MLFFGIKTNLLTKTVKALICKGTLRRRRRKGLAMTPQEFSAKWKTTPSQFGALMGLKSAQANRLLADADASYAQTATASQSDRLKELDLLLSIRSRSGDRAATLAKVDQLIQALEVMLKLIGIPANDEMAAIVKSMRQDCDLMAGHDTSQRLNDIFSKKD